MVAKKKAIGAALAVLALGALLLNGCGRGDAHPEAPGELIHQTTRPEPSTAPVVGEALGVSSPSASRS